MPRMKNLMKYCITLLVCATLLGVNHPMTVFAALEPDNGSYKIKCVGTGQYIAVSNGTVIMSPTGTTFYVQNTEASASVTWFSITYGDISFIFCLMLSNKSYYQL